MRESSPSAATNGVRLVNDQTKVLFVCVHNAARSRIAEAYLRKLGGLGFNVTSAGFEPRDANLLVVEAMRMADVPLLNTGPRPSVFELFRAGQFFHYVIAVCDETSAQRCPIFPWISKRLTWSFPDPREFTGSHEEQLAQVVEVRDAIRARVELWLKELDALSKGRQETRTSTNQTDVPS